MSDIIDIGRATDALGLAMDEMNKQGVFATPIAIGREGVPEGVVVSWALFEQLASEIDRIQAGHVAAQRLGLTADSDPVEALCDDLGIDFQEVEARMGEIP